MNERDWLKRQPLKTLKRQNKSHPEPSHACPPRPLARRAPAGGSPAGQIAWGRGIRED